MNAFERGKKDKKHWFVSLSEHPLTAFVDIVFGNTAGLELVFPPLLLKRLCNATPFSWWFD